MDVPLINVKGKCSHIVSIGFANVLAEQASYGCTQSSIKSDQKDNREKISFGDLSRFQNEKRQIGQFIHINNTLYEDLLQHQSDYIGYYKQFININSLSLIHKS